MTRVYVTGSLSGQLYWELSRSVPECVTWLESDGRVDIRDKQAVKLVIEQLQPDVVINAAAYTAVDKAESEPDLAFAVNEAGVENLAAAASSIGSRMLHVSTDFVFGQSDGKPFETNSAVSPVSVYGKSKLAGEQCLQRLLPQDSLIIRTAWVYSAHGGNFVKTMLRLMGEREELGVVADQTGSPTWAFSLAEAIWRAVDRKVVGISHWTGAGVASWYDFAVAIAEEAQQCGLLETMPQINALTTEQYPTPANRPAYSVLSLKENQDSLGIYPNHWRADLRRMLAEMRGIGR
ncbi:MAG: dTDP-4-dehydrorhamnose reductase [Granulosicoccus sp.]